MKVYYYTLITSQCFIIMAFTHVNKYKTFNIRRLNNDIASLILVNGLKLMRKFASANRLVL